MAEGSTALTFPVSVKGVVFDRSERVLLVRNDRQEWELPGGRIEIGETPEECVAREIHEEVQWKVSVDSIIDTWMYYIEIVRRHVFIVSYGCALESDVDPVLSDEHNAVRLFTLSDIAALNMPDGYKKSINAWASHPTRTRHLL